MPHDIIDYEENRFGSAGFADHHDLRAAGLLGCAGLPIGFSRGKPLSLAGDAPLLTIGGAGSGKLRDLLSYVVCAGPKEPMLINDPRGELAAISIHGLAPQGIRAYCWNPVGLCDLPQHGCNPLDVLKPHSPSLFADTRFIVEGLIPLSGSANGKYFEMRAREFASAMILSRVEQNGFTSLPDLYRTLQKIDGDPNGWADQLEAMLSSRFEAVRAAAAEMLTKQQDSPKEFGGIIGELSACTSFLGDPVLRHALEDGFSLKELVHTDSDTPVTRIYLNAPAEYLSIWSPVIRLFFIVTMLYKGRAPHACRVNLIVDEAAQMGNFEALLRSFSYGRGQGVRAWALFRDISQISRNFGPQAVQSFMGSAQLRQFFGVRDYETAKLVSSMLGNKTLEYDDTPQQRAAKRQKFQMVRDVMDGADPFERAYDVAHFAEEAVHRTKQVRAMLSPDEILALPEDRQILFISGKNIKPILAEKKPYFTRRDMAGKYLPNPYHPPADQISVKTALGRRSLKVLCGPVPRQYRAFPQYAGGQARWVKGFPLK